VRASSGIAAIDGTRVSVVAVGGDRAGFRRQTGAHRVAGSVDHRGAPVGTRRRHFDPVFFEALVGGIAALAADRPVWQRRDGNRGRRTAIRETRAEPLAGLLCRVCWVCRAEAAPDRRRAIGTDEWTGSGAVWILIARTRCRGRQR